MYDIYLGDQVVGNADVIREGLYHKISCRCSLPGDVVYKIVATCGDQQVDLGVCIPKESSFGVDTKLPIKRLGVGELRFRAVAKYAPFQGNLIPINADEPFDYLDKLNKACLVLDSGQVGILLKE